MNVRHRIVWIVSLALLLALGACGTQSTTPTVGPGAGGTAEATTTPTPAPTASPAPTPIPSATRTLVPAPATTPLPTSTPVTLSFIQQPMQILVAGRAIDAPVTEAHEYGDVPADYGIYSIDTDGKNLHRLDPDGVMDYYPRWSPDAGQITFTRATPDVTGIGWNTAVIMVMDADGSNERVLTDPSGYSFNSVWSPDGRQILFERVRTLQDEQEPYSFFASVMNADGSNLYDVGGMGLFPTDPSWSPDGSHVVFTVSALDSATDDTMSYSLVVASTDGSDPHVIYGPDRVASPVWSPDGTTIAFTRASASPQQFQTTFSIWTVDVDGMNPRDLTTDKFISAVGPAWSPDGTKIAFERLTPSAGLPATNVALVSVMNADGSDFHDVGFVGDQICTPSWSPDSRAVAFLVTAVIPDTSEPYLDDTELHLAAANGSEQVTILPHFFVSSGYTEPVWRPGNP